MYTRHLQHVYPAVRMRASVFFFSSSLPSRLTRDIFSSADACGGATRGHFFHTVFRYRRESFFKRLVAVGRGTRVSSSPPTSSSPPYEFCARRRTVPKEWCPGKIFVDFLRLPLKISSRIPSMTWVQHFFYII